jgi:hypothetical protein
MPAGINKNGRVKKAGFKKAARSWVISGKSEGGAARTMRTLEGESPSIPCKSASRIKPDIQAQRVASAERATASRLKRSTTSRGKNWGNRLGMRSWIKRTDGKERE